MSLKCHENVTINCALYQIIYILEKGMIPMQPVRFNLIIEKLGYRLI